MVCFIEGSLYGKPCYNECVGKQPKCSLYRGIVSNFINRTNKRQKIERVIFYNSASVMLYMTEPLAEKLLSCYKVKGFSSLLVCFAFIFCCEMTFIRYIGVNFTSGLLNCVRYNEDFVIPVSRFAISRFCSIHFTVTLAGLKNIVCYTEKFVI